MFQREGVIEIRLFGDDVAELPVHEFRGHALQIVHAGAVEMAEVGETFAGAGDAVMAAFEGAGGELAGQLVAGVAGEIAEAGGHGGFMADPVIGEGLEEAVDVGCRGLSESNSRCCRGCGS